VRVNIAIPEAHVKKPVLDGALEAVTRLNEDLIRSGESPTSHQLIEAGARWQPEKPGAEHFDHGGLIAARRHGDCDDWAPLHAATLRVTGEDPGATAVVRRSGGARWHAIVQRSDGTIDDPSLAAGMPGPAADFGVRGATLPLMARGASVVGGTYLDTPKLALRPIADRHGEVEAWQARADLPWHWAPGNSPEDLAMVSLHRSPVSSQAIVGALRGAWRLGICSGDVEPDHLARLAALADACEGCPYEELAELYGQHHADAAAQVVGSFFGKLGRGLKKLAKKGLKAGLSFVPGGGLASLALDAASPHTKKHVARGQHLPPSQRAAALEPPARPRAATPEQRLPGYPPAPAPSPVHVVEPNAALLTTFADRLQRAYEFSAARPQPGAGLQSARPHGPHAARRRATAPRRGDARPPAAWPR